MYFIDDRDYIRKENPMPFDKLTKVKGDHTRHIEQLWDEIKKLRERVSFLEKSNENRPD